jgi:hypothetical protein
MGGSGLIAARMVLAILKARRELATRTRPLGMDTAPHPVAHLALQRDAAGRLHIRAAHGAEVLRNGQGQLDGNTAGADFVGLGPVEGHTVQSAAGPATQAGVHPVIERRIKKRRDHARQGSGKLEIRWRDSRIGAAESKRGRGHFCGGYWWAHQDSNLEPKDYESSALTVEL